MVWRRQQRGFGRRFAADGTPLPPPPSVTCANAAGQEFCIGDADVLLTPDVAMQRDAGGVFWRRG